MTRPARYRLRSYMRKKRYVHQTKQDYRQGVIDRRKGRNQRKLNARKRYKKFKARIKDNAKRKAKDIAAGRYKIKTWKYDKDHQHTNRK